MRPGVTSSSIAVRAENEAMGSIWATWAAGAGGCEASDVEAARAVNGVVARSCEVAGIGPAEWGSRRRVSRRSGIFDGVADIMYALVEGG